MATYHHEDAGFKLIPFLQNRDNSVSFFLSSPFDEENILTLVVGMDDYGCPDTFMDMLSVAVDSLLNQHPPVKWR
jgi:hypothetical protein